MEIYSLTPEEANQILLEAHTKKEAARKLKEYQAELRKAKILKFKTAEELFSLLETKITIDDKNREVVQELCYYFTNDPRTKLDPEKGIILRGSVGCGKTTLMNLLNFNQHNSYYVFSCRQVSYDYATNGIGAITRFNNPLRSKDSIASYGQEFIGACFDDLGTEQEKKNFGNQVNVMGDILLNRYDNPNLKGKTHITTNLSTKEIEECYGVRVRSRIREMFNDVKFPVAVDRRK